MLIKLSFASLPKWVGWINYRIISLLVKQDKQVSYFAHFLLFASLSCTRLLSLNASAEAFYVERYWGEVLLL